MHWLFVRNFSWWRDKLINIECKLSEQSSQKWDWALAPIVNSWNVLDLYLDIVLHDLLGEGEHQYQHWHAVGRALGHYVHHWWIVAIHDDLFSSELCFHSARAMVAMSSSSQLMLMSWSQISMKGKGSCISCSGSSTQSSGHLCWWKAHS